MANDRNEEARHDANERRRLENRVRRASDEKLEQMRRESEERLGWLDAVAVGSFGQAALAEGSRPRLGRENRDGGKTRRTVFNGRIVEGGPFLARAAARFSPIGLGASALSFGLGKMESRDLETIRSEQHRRALLRAGEPLGDTSTPSGVERLPGGAMRKRMPF